MQTAPDTKTLVFIEAGKETDMRTKPIWLKPDNSLPLKATTVSFL